MAFFSKTNFVIKILQKLLVVVEAKTPNILPIFLAKIFFIF
jgi:hypothetical protein